MLTRKAARLFNGLIVAVATWGMAVSAQAQEKKIKIGVIYDLTGPLAGGGSELQYIGAKIMLDRYSKTGVEGYKVEAVLAVLEDEPACREEREAADKKNDKNARKQDNKPGDAKSKDNAGSTAAKPDDKAADSELPQDDAE